MEYKSGDKVFLKRDICLGAASGKKAKILRKVRPNEVTIVDYTAGSTCVYEVWIPSHGTIFVLDGLIEGMA